MNHFNSKKYNGQEFKGHNLSHGVCEDWGEVPVYDDGFGKLYIYYESFGNWIVPAGICRAMSWEDAFSIARDEFCKEASWDELDQDEKESFENEGECDGYAYSDCGQLVHVDYNERLEPLENAFKDITVYFEVDA